MNDSQPIAREFSALSLATISIVSLKQLQIYTFLSLIYLLTFIIGAAKGFIIVLQQKQVLPCQ